jgi:flagellar motility protein MotE (MotC chaperone)
MADFDDNNIRKEEPAALDSRPAQENKLGKKKKKKKRGCGCVSMLLLLAVGVAAGIQASGGADLRPYVYEVVPRLPKVGPALTELLGIPAEYSLTVTERRQLELNEWETQIASALRSIDERQKNLDSVSKDLSGKEDDLETQREELAARLEALSDDAVAPGAGTASSQRKEELEDIIRTFQERSPRNAASILEKLSPNLAVAVLDGLPMDSRANLLGRMEAVTAAGLMEQLTELQESRAKRGK